MVPLLLIRLSSAALASVDGFCCTYVRGLTPELEVSPLTPEGIVKSLTPDRDVEDLC